MTVGLGPQGTRGIVLAGSYPNGRSPFARLCPRPLLPIAHRPIISYPLRWLVEAEVQGITVCVNGSWAGVGRAAAAEVGSSLSLSFQQDRNPRGTAGSARDAALATGARTFFVVNGTAIPGIDSRALLEAHAAAGASATVVVCASTAADARGLSPVGIYAFDRRAFELVGAEGFLDIKETLLPRLHAAGLPVITFATERALPKVLSTETYLATNDCMIPAAIEATPPPGFDRVGKALVHTRAWLSPRARVVGPVIVGAGVHVDEDATLVGPSVVGAGCQVGARAVVSRSVLWDSCRLGSDSMLDRCLLAEGAVVAPGEQLYGAIKTRQGLPQEQDTPPAVSRPAATSRAAGPASLAAVRAPGP